MRKTLPCVFLLSIFSVTVVAQKQAPAPKLQTPRQALIEMISKGGESVLAYLSTESEELVTTASVGVPTGAR